MFTKKNNYLKSFPILVFKNERRFLWKFQAFNTLKTLFQDPTSPHANGAHASDVRENGDKSSASSRDRERERERDRPPSRSGSSSSRSTPSLKSKDVRRHPVFVFCCWLIFRFRHFLYCLSSVFGFIFFAFFLSQKQTIIYQWSHICFFLHSQQPSCWI